MAKPRVVIVGPGRMGQGLGVTLKRRGYGVILLARTPRDLPAPLMLHAGPWADVTRAAELLLVAVPDDAITAVAAELAARDAVGREQVVLHLSGLLDRNALSPLAATGAALGSFHPLQTVVDSATAGERLKGAYAGIEGDDRAIAAAERLANTLRMVPLLLSAESKPAYHAGAAFVANYTAALLGVAEGLAVRAGVAPELADKIYLPLLNGAVANLIAYGPVRGLTGPVRRGDAATIESHLEALEPDERALYGGLGLAALKLARAGGLPEPVAQQIESMLAAARSP